MEPPDLCSGGWKPEENRRIILKPREGLANIESVNNSSLNAGWTDGNVWYGRWKPEKNRRILA
jgi:hypothetical protein